VSSNQLTFGFNMFVKLYVYCLPIVSCAFSYTSSIKLLVIVWNVSGAGGIQHCWTKRQWIWPSAAVLLAGLGSTALVQWWNLSSLSLSATHCSFYFVLSCCALCVRVCIKPWSQVRYEYNADASLPRGPYKEATTKTKVFLIPCNSS